MTRQLLVSTRAQHRLALARRHLVALGASREVLVVGSQLDAVNRLIRSTATGLAPDAATFGWHRLSLGTLAGRLAATRLSSDGLAPASPLALEAAATRVISTAAGSHSLGRFEVVARRPGFARALAATYRELSLAGTKLDALAGVDPELATLLAALAQEFTQLGLATPGDVYRVATEVANGGDHPLLGLDLMLIDPLLEHVAAVRLAGALSAQSVTVLATAPREDRRAVNALERVLDLSATNVDEPATSSLGRLQQQLFRATADPGKLDEDVQIVSAPGESRECVEIARQITNAAARGVAFERIAIALRSPEKYSNHLQEAFGRAKIPYHFSKGSRLPDPGGRALLALLACAREGLSARRFAEYVSLGQVPRADESGASPEPAPATERWVVPDEELAFLGAARSREVPSSDTIAEGTEPTGQSDSDSPIQSGTLQVPRRWERLLVEAAVVSSPERWRRRLDGLAAQYSASASELETDDPARERLERQALQLDHLRRFALPLIDQLAELRELDQRETSTWGEWIEQLSLLAGRALARPERVYEQLAELAPMSTVGPARLAEVELLLTRRLGQLRSQPTSATRGCVFVGSCDEMRGLEFDWVFVPGLAEKLFPQKVSEDPLLLDADRAKVDAALDTNEDRVALERRALHVAVGAANQRLVVSFPRLDIERSRPRVPSFYGLEILRAALGSLPSFDELARQAQPGAAERLGWPAPVDPAQAIDDAEFDLAMLSQLEGQEAAQTRGAAHYLLQQNRHLARSLRARGRRWLRRWSAADGLVDLSAEALGSLEPHQLSRRAYSATALQKFAACPYQFYASAIMKLSPREAAEGADELDALTRGRLIHDVQQRVLSSLREEQLLPLDDTSLGRGYLLLETHLAAAAKELEDLMAPAIERVFRDQIAAIGVDLREWLSQIAADANWTPEYFELSFGLSDLSGRDPRSSTEPVELAGGLRLRGAIDLVERSTTGHARVTDHKTGRASAPGAVVIGGGEILQPTLYALALEQLEPGRTVDEGRLYYCTQRGGYEDRRVPLDDRARKAVRLNIAVLEEHLRAGFLPAAPREGHGDTPQACTHCDYRVICGPYEEIRVRLKPKDRLARLQELRSES